MPVEIGGSSSLPLPSGASTLAEQQNQTTQLGSISTNTSDAASDTDAIRQQTDGVEGTLTSIFARLSPDSSGPTNLAPKTVPTGSAETIATSTAVTRYVRATSDFANTKTVYIGGSGVTVANGQPLGPGDVYTNSDVNNANLIYCISADAAQVLRIEVL